MRKSNTQSISKVLRDFIQDTNIGSKLKEMEVIKAWDSMLGKTIASYTSKLSIRNRILYVTLKSPVVKSELMMMKQELLTRLNEEVGEKVITTIVFK